MRFKESGIPYTTVTPGHQRAFWQGFEINIYYDLMNEKAPWSVVVVDTAGGTVFRNSEPTRHAAGKSVKQFILNRQPVTGL